MFHSIRCRLGASYMLLTLLAVSSVGLLATLAVRRYAQLQEVKSLTANAKAVASQAVEFLWPSVSPLELNQLAQAASFFGNVRVRIYDNRGQVLADSGSQYSGEAVVLFMLSGLPGMPAEGWIVGLAPSRSPEKFREPFSILKQLPPGVSLTVIRRFQSPWGNLFSFGGTAEVGAPLEPEPPVAGDGAQRSERMVTVPITDGAHQYGSVELSAGTDFGAETLLTIQRGLLLAGAISVLLAGVFGLFMGNRLSAPLVELTGTATRMSAGDLSVRAKVDSQDEIGRLAAQFNQMAGQLQASFSQLEAERDSLRRFIADASHELRTPITALRNFNELLQGAATDDPEARSEFLRESGAQIERLAWITQNLLDLSRLDTGLADLEMKEHDLREAISSAASAFQSAAAEKGIDLQTRLPNEAVLVICDRARVEIVLTNLLDNALKFTPAGGSVEVGAAVGPDQWRLWVQDTGAGIADEDLPHIFERFYRGKNGISAGRSPGSGLGLSIVKGILDAHGWSITTENLPEGGAIFTIFP